MDVGASQFNVIVLPLTAPAKVPVGPGTAAREIPPGDAARVGRVPQSFPAPKIPAGLAVRHCQLVVVLENEGATGAVPPSGPISAGAVGTDGRPQDNESAIAETSKGGRARGVMECFVAIARARPVWTDRLSTRPRL